MQVNAIFSTVTITSSEMSALRSHAYVVLMQEIALIAFFAETFEPMLANEDIARMRNGVLVGTILAERAEALAEGFAIGSFGRDAEAIFFLQEVREAKLRER